MTNQQLAKHAVIQTVTASELAAIADDYESKGYEVRFPEPRATKAEGIQPTPIQYVVHLCTTCGRQILKQSCGGCGQEYFEF